MMHFNKKHFAKLLLNTIKLPLTCGLIGIALLALGYADDAFSAHHGKTIFDVADKVGAIFLAIATVTFVYKFIALFFLESEKKLLPNHKISALILASIRKGIRIIFILIALNIIITIAGPTPFYLALTKNLINAAIIAAIGWVTIEIINTIEAVIHHYIAKSSTDQNRIKTLYTKTRILRNIATVLIIIITIAAILMSYDSVRNIGISMLASAGFLTAIIGLSAQKTLFSVFSGLQIALSHIIKIGDMIVVENESGIVEEITLIYVIVRLADRRRLTVPISYFVDKPFENWSHDADGLRSSIHFFVDFMMPIEPMREELDRILAESKYWNGVAKKLQVSDLTGQAVEIRIQVSADNSDNLGDLRTEVREKMLGFIRKHYPTCFPKTRQEKM
jgi:small-conductance mechanosensitive channel